MIQARFTKAKYELLAKQGWDCPRGTEVLLLLLVIARQIDSKKRNHLCGDRFSIFTREEVAEFFLEVFIVIGVRYIPQHLCVPQFHYLDSPSGAFPFSGGKNNSIHALSKQVPCLEWPPISSFSSSRFLYDLARHWNPGAEWRVALMAFICFMVSSTNERSFPADNSHATTSCYKGLQSPTNEQNHDQFEHR